MAKAQTVAHIFQNARLGAKTVRTLRKSKIKIHVFCVQLVPALVFFPAQLYRLGGKPLCKGGNIHDVRSS